MYESKMPMCVQVNGRPVFNMTHEECCREIKMSGQTLTIECERGEQSSFFKNIPNGQSSAGLSV